MCLMVFYGHFFRPNKSWHVQFNFIDSGNTTLNFFQNNLMEIMKKGCLKFCNQFNMFDGSLEKRGEEAKLFITRSKDTVFTRV